MAEAVQSFCSPNQLRFLFAHLLMNIPVTAIELFEEYQEALSADYLDQYDSPIMVMNKCLEGIAKHLAAQGSRLTDFGLPQPQNLIDEISMEALAFDHRRTELTEMAIASQEQLLPQQLDAFDTIMNNIDKIAIGEIPEHTCFFLDGKAGRGKTYVVNTIVNYLRGQGDIVVITGSTALSVTLYERGRTAHSAFGIPVVENNMELQSTLSIRSDRAKLLSKSSLIIWEEMPMANKAAIECADEFLELVLANGKPFGGKVFLGLGDFRQVASVVKSAGPTATLEASIRSSYLWEQFKILRLDTPIRNASDLEYAEWVDQIGDGCQESNESFVNLDLIESLDSIEEAIDFLFPTEVLQNPAIVSHHAFLSPLNINVDQFNLAILERFPTMEERTYYSHDCIKEDPNFTSSAINILPSGEILDFLSMLKEPGVPTHKLILKVGY
ncbi:uncharacterized protein H6S33_007824 [Morchella sextelata]|uniref:uncharacterized protein n=1 Tax=Morchella sextelata TaxID=1174677 RepID=UPI001D049595|nr:uncharacterized protein H6S33_007824 [Morchella sextelata]KAH0603502.1 hypothetical protein H6S33_007824 [Morchella sextelata]